MKAFTQTILFSMALMTTSVVGAAVYKYIDENGNVAFGDRPVDGSEKVKIEPANGPSRSSRQSGGLNSLAGSDGGNSEDPENGDGLSEDPEKMVTNYSSLELLTPRPGKVISDQASAIQIIFLPTPELGQSDQLVITVDGKEISKGRDANLSLQNLPVGSYTVQGRILDSEGNAKVESPLVDFHVKSASEIAQAQE